MRHAAFRFSSRAPRHPPPASHPQEREGSESGTILALTDLDDCTQTPEQVAAQFNGVATRVSVGQAALRYIAAGGYLLGTASLFIFMLTQTTRIMGDWWIR